MEINDTTNLTSFIIFTNDNFLFLNVVYQKQLNITNWGPKRDPLTVVIPITLIYSVIFLSGVVGNIGTCIVIANNKSMHTATNYYLFSLAISDLLLLISGLPQEMYSIWSRHPYIFGEAFCLLQGFAAETSANATVLTITAFTVERYIAICHPFLSQTLSKLSRAVKFIILIWLVAISLAIPQALAFGITIYDEEHKYCQITRVILPYSFEISTLVFFIIPMTVITILYIRIGLQLRKSTKIIAKSRSIRMKKITTCRTNVSIKQKKNRPIVCVEGREAIDGSSDNNRENNCIHTTEATKHVVKMLVAVVVAFFICWAPFHAQRLLAIYGQPNSRGMVKIFMILTYVSGVLYYLSTSINPLLYHILSHKFRIAFKKTFSNCLRKGQVKRRSYSSLSGKLSFANSHVSTDSGRPQYSDSENHPKDITVTKNKPKKFEVINHENKIKRIESEGGLKHLFCAYDNVNEQNEFSDKMDVRLFQENNERLKKIEIFQSQQLKIKRVEGKIQIRLNLISIPKSVTVPQIAANPTHVDYNIDQNDEKDSPKYIAL